MDPDATIGIMLNAIIRSDASGMQTNNVNVSGTTETGDVTDSASADVDVLTHDISVNKTASPTEGVPGTNVTFTITVDNIGDLRLDPVIVEDKLPEGLNYVSADPEGSVSETGVTWWVDPIEPLDSVNITLVAQIDANASGTQTNIVDVLGMTTTGQTSRAVVTDSDTADVKVLIPDIRVNKTATPTAGMPGTDVTFTIKVNNTGDCTLDPVKLVDTLPTGMSYVSSSPAADSQVGSTVTWNNLGALSTSGSKTIYLIAHIDAGASGTLNNTANATGKPPAGDNVSDVVYEEVTALEPEIRITKVASPSSGAPSTYVNFSIEVTNTGDCILGPVKLVDTLPAGMSYVSSSPAADTQDGSTVTWTNLGSLSASNSKTIYLIAHIDSDATGILNNTANATGTPPAGDNVSDEVYGEVTALVPDIKVTKVASPSSGAPSTNVNFSIVVTNTGDCTLDPVKLVDMLPAGMSYVSSSPAVDSQVGSTVTWNNLGSLLASNSKTIYLIAHIDSGATGILNNTANATGTPPTGDNVSDECYEEVTALELEIQVTKVASPSAGAPSTEVNFTIEVTNTGDCTLDPVKLVDTLPTGMSYVSDYSGGIESPTGTITWSNVGPLNSTEDTTISMVAHIDVGATGMLTDTVTAIGKPPAGVNVSDSDTAAVLALSPDIRVNKTATPTAGMPGTNVTYTINVTNTGDCTLNAVTVRDSLPDGMSYVAAGTSPEPSTVDGKDIEWANVCSLAPAETTTISLVAQIDANATGMLTDIVKVSGTPPSGENVTDTDTADVVAFIPDINVTKTTDQTVVVAGANVTFTLIVTNTGHFTLNSVEVIDTLPAGMYYVSATSEADNKEGPIVWTNVSALHPGESTTITLIARIEGGAAGTLTNNVNVSGRTLTGATVLDSDIAIGIVISSFDLILEKTCSPTIVPPGGNETCKIKYNNKDVVDLHNVVITKYYQKGVTFISASPTPDLGTNNKWTIGTLAANTSGIINITVKVPESRGYSFFESGSVLGEGFVMVSKDLATEQKPHTLENVVTLSCNELGPISATASTTVSGVPGTSISITEHGSGIYESEESLNLCTENRSISIVKTTNAVYKPTTFNFSKSFVVNFTPKWKQDIETRNCVIDNVIRKRITDATYIEDETRSKADNTSTAMEFDLSFNGSLYIGARTNDTAISETYIGEFDVLQDIQIGEGPIPSPSPTPTPPWLP